MWRYLHIVADRQDEVSIHTPTQGVTSINFIGNKLTTVSIHTPTQGVTTVLLCLLFSIPGFNPHTHAGCDKDEANIEDVALVSIHTPTQGVTHLCASVQKTQKFQSTHPRRVWLFTSLLACPQGKFQSTHPRRVWPSYEGKLSVYQVSIHTPTQGVTMNKVEVGTLDEFQSTHPRRVWR